MNFDVFRHNPKAAAALVAREGGCWACPMYKKCDSASTHDPYKCYEMWNGFFKENPEKLDCVDNLAETLEGLIDCDKCTVAKVNECDFIDTQDCALELRKWLCGEFTTISNADRLDCKVRAQAANKNSEN